MSPNDAQPGEPGSSSTPSRPNAPAQVASSLKSTPNSRGAATVSDHISLVGVHVDQIRPWIQRDIQQAEKCPVDAMLQVLLQRASLDPKTKQPDLLKRCLKAVLPVCNGHAKAAVNDKDLHSSHIKEALDRYVLPGNERNFYEPFTTATNIALACLEGIEVDGMRAVSLGPNIICQRNDKQMFQLHQNKQSDRRPDVVILPLQSSRNAFPRGCEGMGDVEHMLQNARNPPEESLVWKDVLASIEFKRKAKKLSGPPSSYSVKDYIATDPDYLRVETAAPDGPVTAAPGSSQTQAKKPAPAHAPTRRSTRHTTSSQNASTNSGSKRKAAESLQSSGKRPKVDDTDTRLDATVQTGLYAAEMFAANVAVNYLINLIVVDDIVWIWYYDRQGTIQCSGINFIQDLPRFMVLLYALQRFDLGDWGRNKDFKEVKEKGGGVKEGLLRFELGDMDLVLQTDHPERVTHYGLKGRATNVFPVTSKKLVKEYEGIEEDGMVAKIFWGEEQRTSEPEILDQVYEIAKLQETVKDHVPQLLRHYKVENPTSAVREALGIANPTKGSRVLYILVFRKLRPITELDGEDFFNVWRQCILCHLALWKGGVLHRDVSPGNMMYYRKKGALMGVLNDYDLSSLAIALGPEGNERTGTVPFMALDLLSQKGQAGEVKHLYRHDLESFIWVLVWVSFRYREGVLRPRETRHFDAWATTDAVACGKEKSWFLLRFLEFKVPGIHPQMWRLIVECLLVLQAEVIRRATIQAVQDMLPEAGQGQSTHAEEVELDDDVFLSKFTSTQSWVRLSKGLP
ncbi:hypothetical protein DFH29DRAFT_845929 [Suillus ampliporus]|nr:hypothetical protein DFH29DRAFT_845929 [Suillus ampliporus]